MDLVKRFGREEPEPTTCSSALSSGSAPFKGTSCRKIHLAHGGRGTARGCGSPHRLTDTPAMNRKLARCRTRPRREPSDYRFLSCRSGRCRANTPQDRVSRATFPETGGDHECRSARMTGRCPPSTRLESAGSLHIPARRAQHHAALPQSSDGSPSLLSCGSAGKQLQFIRVASEGCPDRQARYSWMQACAVCPRVQQQGHDLIDLQRRQG